MLYTYTCRLVNKYQAQLVHTLVKVTNETLYTQTSK